MIPDYSQMNVAVLGAGESGSSAALLLRHAGARVTVLDSGDPVKLMPRVSNLISQDVAVSMGEEALSVATAKEFQMAVLSPGIDPAAPLVKALTARAVPIIGELELAWQFCKCPVLAITGTNGKTTTTELVDRMCRAAGLQSEAAGNIGPAFSAKVLETDHLDYAVIETSSFQLEAIEKFHPRVAVWLGFAPDHLDRYATMDEYYRAKLRIFDNQTAEDWAVVNLRSTLPKLAAQTLTFSAYESGADFSLQGDVIHFRGTPVLDMREAVLKGTHNVENLMAALGVGHAIGLDFSSVVPALLKYAPLPHRCEVVRELDGVRWINDSKGTNPDSVEKALDSADRPVILIAGGKDKGFAFDDLTDRVVAKCRAVVVLGEIADALQTLWGARVPVFHAGRSLEEAVKLARTQAQKGDQVLFSPGTSSFDMFKNYADRGEQFRAQVRKLQPYS